MEPVFPLGPRASASEALLQHLQRHYPIGSIHHYQDIGGAYNLNVHMTTDVGTYVVRMYRPWVTPERLTALQRLKQWLSAQRIPTALPITTEQGQLFMRYEHRLLEVEPFLPNTGAVETWAAYERAFALLGQFHTVVNIYPSAGMLPQPAVENYALPPVLLQWVQHTKQRIQQSQHPQRDRAICLCDDVGDLLARVQRWWEETGADLPRQLVHGDYGVGNLLWQNQAIIAVADFDFVADHERIFDLGYALFWMFERIEGSLQPEQRSWSHGAEMIASYTSHSQQPLTKWERHGLLFEMVRVPLYWIGEAGFLANPVDAVLSRAENVATAGWIMEHMNELAW